MSPATLGYTSTIVVVLFSAVAAAIDLRTRRIPDALTLSAIAVGLLVAGIEGYATLALRIVTVIIVLGVAVALHSLRVWGGGDGKLISAVAAWKGAVIVGETFLWAFLIGGVIALSILIAKRAFSRAHPTRIPFAPLIAAGVTVAAIAETMHFRLLNL